MLLFFMFVREDLERYDSLRSSLQNWTFVESFYVRYNRVQALVFTTFSALNLKFCCIVLRALGQVQALVFTPFRASNLEMCFIILGNLEQSSSISIHYVQGFSIEKVLFYFMFVREDLER